jgi:hypothetical protein
VKNIYTLKSTETVMQERVFCPKMGDFVGDWITFRDEELHNLWSSLATIGAVKSRRMR